VLAKASERDHGAHLRKGHAVEGPLRRRAVALIHHPTAREHGAPAEDRDTLRGIERALFPRLARLIATSPHTAARLVAEFDVPAERIGIVEPGTDLGPLRPSVAADTGLTGVRVIAPGTHDTASAVAAVPAAEPPSARPDWCYVSLGTWALVGAELDRPLVTPECLARNFTNEGGVGGTTRLLKNVGGLWLVQQCRAAWQRAGKEWTWDQLTALAAEAPPLVTIVDPDHPSLVAPADMPEAIRRLASDSGEPVPQSTAAVVRAALESVAAKIRSTLAELDGLLGRRVGRIHVVGGGVKNAMLCQMIADAANRPVVAGPIEATAIGNLLVQLVARGGGVDLRTVRAVVRDSFELARYEPRDPGSWDARLRRG
jgi:rhamnulokinase